jgi:hypothetical protein
LERTGARDGHDKDAGRKEGVMKAAVLFTGSGPIVILTSFPSFSDPKFIQKLEAKGLTKFIAYEVPMADVQTKYGQHFDVVVKDVKQSDDLRVLDYNGHRVFHNFSFAELGQPFYYEQ